jgi:hypothetical protein
MAKKKTAKAEETNAAASESAPAANNGLAYLGDGMGDGGSGDNDTPGSSCVYGINSPNGPYQRALDAITHVAENYPLGQPGQTPGRFSDVLKNTKWGGWAKENILSWYPGELDQQGFKGVMSLGDGMDGGDGSDVPADGGAQDTGTAGLAYCYSGMTLEEALWSSFRRHFLYWHEKHGFGGGLVHDGIALACKTGRQAACALFAGRH